MSDVAVGSSYEAANDGETTVDRESAGYADQADHATAEDNRAASAHDQALSTADPRAFSRDRLAAERELAPAPPLDSPRRRANDVSEAARKISTAERAATTMLRAQTAAESLDAADRRDEASRLRDLAAQVRDRAAEEQDHLAAQSEAMGAVAEARVQAAADRARAAADRERAAADREQAAIDRQQVRVALSEAHLDELTGAYRRGLGTLALQREINRARHAGGQLVLAFVDVDGLKKVNDRYGHAAGDALLVDVAAAIRSKLRSYDPIVRFGGDEFVCAFSDFDLDGVRLRFDDILAALDRTRKGCSISVGLAELRSEDTLDDLTARGDDALYEAKRRKQGDVSSNGRSGIGGPRHRRGILRLPHLRYLRRHGPGRG